MDDDQSLNDDESDLLKNIPFTEKELEEDDYDEEAFMDKLSKYLEQKYQDEDKGNDDDDNDKDNKLSGLDIFTMKEEELNEIMPIDESEISNQFRYIPTFQNENEAKQESKSKRNNNRNKRRKNKYYKVPLPKTDNKNKRKSKSKRNNKNQNKTTKLNKNQRFIAASKQ